MRNKTSEQADVSFAIGEALFWAQVAGEARDWGQALTWLDRAEDIAGHPLKGLAEQRREWSTALLARPA